MKKTTNKTKTILIVEDELDIIKLLEARLKKNGYEVVSAKSGYEALYKYLRIRPSLILLDIMIPNLDGNEVCREIRREICDEKTPIIMLTAKKEDFDRIKGRVVGATVYMTKPFEIEMLLGKIKELLGI